MGEVKPWKSSLVHMDQSGKYHAELGGVETLVTKRISCKVKKGGEANAIAETTPNCTSKQIHCFSTICTPCEIYWTSKSTCNLIMYMFL